MDKERVLRRLNLLGCSAGSVVSVATWCSLHAQYADVVVGCLMDKLRSESTADGIRASVLYVVHEMVLTCVSSGTTEPGKQSVLMAISKALPNAVQAVVDREGGDTTVFAIALERIVTWWVALRAFPSSWLQELHRKQMALEARLTHDTGAPASTAALSLPGQLQKLTDAMSRYRDAKAQWVSERRQLGLADGSSPTTATPATEAALRQLAAAHKTAESVLGSGSTAVAWCEAERVELLGLHPQGVAGVDGVKREAGAEPPSARVKLEGGVAEPATGSPASPGPATGESGQQAGGDDDDDVLGAFYGS